MTKAKLRLRLKEVRERKLMTQIALAERSGLTQTTISAIERHANEPRFSTVRRLALGSVWQDTDLIFERGDGQTLHPNTLRSRFLRTVKRLGLPSIRFHDLRHTAATLMLSNDVHPKIVQ